MSIAATLRPNEFKRALAHNQRQVGLWLTLESPNDTEVVAGAGSDLSILARRSEGLRAEFTTPAA